MLFRSGAGEDPVPLPAAGTDRICRVDGDGTAVLPGREDGERVLIFESDLFQMSGLLPRNSGKHFEEAARPFFYPWDVCAVVLAGAEFGFFRISHVHFRSDRSAVRGQKPRGCGMTKKPVFAPAGSRSELNNQRLFFYG